jgi:hypothetical protein
MFFIYLPHEVLNQYLVIWRQIGAVNLLADAGIVDCINLVCEYPKLPETWLADVAG